MSPFAFFVSVLCGVLIVVTAVLAWQLHVAEREADRYCRGFCNALDQLNALRRDNDRYQESLIQALRERNEANARAARAGQAVGWIHRPPTGVRVVDRFSRN